MMDNQPCTGYDGWVKAGQFPPTLCRLFFFGDGDGDGDCDGDNNKC